MSEPIIKNASEQTDETQISPAEAARDIRAQAQTYGLISRLYRVEVNQELLDAMREMSFPEHTGNERADKGYGMILGYIESSGPNVLTDLAVDYVNAFLGHRNDSFCAAYPYESVYTSEKRLLMREARDEVLAIYRSEGFEKDESWKEGEDHIALELEFLQRLQIRMADALEAGNDEEATRLAHVQANFLDEHVLSWAGMLTVDMRRFAKTDFYRGLAWLTDGFLDIQRTLLADMLGEDAVDEGFSMDDDDLDVREASPSSVAQAC